MPFGISTAPEEFQRWLHEVFEGLSGVEVIADDILVYESGYTEEQAVENQAIFAAILVAIFSFWRI
jgi:hypothetical protein